eukprot:jgi/Botrbrau1/14812/Bobra.0332s0005.1
MYVGNLNLGVCGSRWRPVVSYHSSLCASILFDKPRIEAHTFPSFPGCTVQRWDRRRLAHSLVQAIGTQAELNRILGTTVSQEVQEFWRGHLSQVEKPSALELLQWIDLSHPLGFLRSHQQSKATPLVHFYLDKKLLHPDKLLIVRVGEFYETYGIDAILMVQWAGLNPMGRASKHSPPRAGLPRTNLRRTLRDLLDAQLVRVVCEEVPEPPGGRGRPKRKERFVSGVVTPASPTYVYGMSEMAEGGEVHSARPSSALRHWVHVVSR